LLQLTVSVFCSEFYLFLGGVAYFGYARATPNQGYPDWESYILFFINENHL
jgi:hypothetical protein